MPLAVHWSGGIRCVYWRDESGGLPMRLVKGAVRGLTAISVGAATLMLDMGVARADELHDSNHLLDHTFTNASGAQVTCTVQLQSTLFRPTGRDAFFGSALTDADLQGSGGSCSDTFVFVDATYRDPSGREKRATADSINGDVFLTVDDVASHFVVQHGVFFGDCSSNCEVLFATSPK